MATRTPALTQSLDEMDGLIRASIIEMTALRVVYEGGERLLCPHMLGRNKEGKVRILCLQIGGESVSGLARKDGPGDWRCLALERFGRVERVAVAWQTAGKAHRRPKCIDQIELEVGDQPEGEPQNGQ